MQDQDRATNETPTRDPNKPYKKHRDGALEIAIWKRDTEKGPVYNTDLKRSYKDEHDDWRTTRAIPERDLLKAARLQERAYTSIQMDREYDRVIYIEQQKQRQQDRSAPVQGQSNDYGRER
ncbi:MAG: hypothetical protein AAGA63_09620 [Pseudomonadota bacterium]